jgi:hypothetical protein
MVIGKCSVYVGEKLSDIAPDFFQNAGCNAAPDTVTTVKDHLERALESDITGDSSNIRFSD